jgi:hypothetical protein
MQKKKKFKDEIEIFKKPHYWNIHWNVRRWMVILKKTTCFTISYN